MEEKKVTANSSSVDIALGYYNDIAGLFNFGSDGPDLKKAITFVFSQTLQREMFFGAWADAYQNGNGEYRLKITSPRDDVSAYATLIPQYIEAGKIALAAYYEQVPYSVRKDWEFLLPFGLAMANVKSIQLLHFPPTETFTYKDYLYSPTNRRWECLLAQNDFDGINNTPVERIIDIAPIAAGGDDGKAIKPFNKDFIPYAKEQLQTFLRPLKVTGYEFTQPIVAYGGPVHDWLIEAFNLTKAPNTLDIVQLKILDASDGHSAASTWVLCANHPSEYLYDTNLPLSEAQKKNGDYPAPITVMCQDLVAAGWQAHMSEHPGDDPHKTLICMQERWGWDAKQQKVKADKVDAVLAIMKEQNQEFGWGKDTFTPTAEQTAATAFALGRSTATDDYACYVFDAKADDVFSAVAMAKSASCDSTKRLMQVGGYVLEWSPPTAKKQEIHYRLFTFDRNSANPLAEEAVAYGVWEKEKFFGDYRSDFGATFEQIELIGFPGYVLSIIPAAGRRTYQLWNVDPQAEDDCLSMGEFKQGGFRDITAASELHVMGNYVLDRRGADYKVWSFDPQSSPPLALPTVQTGSWSTIDDDDGMTTVGEWVVTWKPKNPSAG